MIRLNTIRVPVNFGNVSDIASSTTQTTIGAPIIYIGENGASTPITCSSVALYIGIQDTSTATGGTLSQFTASIQLSGSATSSVFSPFAGTLANTAENWGGIIGPIDYTNYFTSSFGLEPAITASVSVAGTISTGTGTAIRGVYGYMDITYKFDDTSTRRTKTVCVPYESGTGTLTTTANTAFCTLPQLTGAGGWLSGYSNLSIKHRWIEIKGNCNNNNTATNHTLSYSFDGSGTNSLPTRESALASDSWQIFLVDISSLSTTSTHTFDLWNSLATRWANIIVNEWITFEYDSTGNTEALNYIEFPISIPNTFTNTLVDRWAATVNIPEPNPITVRKCAVELRYTGTGAATMQVRGGTKSYRAYAQSANVVAGQFSLQHGLDSGSAQGSAYTLSKGDNNVTLDIYRSAGSSTYLSGIFKMLYSSGIASSSIDDHSSIKKELIRNINFTSTTNTATTAFFEIPETYYYIQAASYNIFAWPTTAGSNDTNVLSVNANEFQGGGYLITGVGLLNNTMDNELSYVERSNNFVDLLKRYPGDLYNGLFITSSRSYRSLFTVGSKYGSTVDVTYHNITHNISGSISNSSGGTVNLELIDLNSNKVFSTSSRIGDGSYNFIVYDDSKQYQVIAYESSTYKGLSKQGTPANDFDISLFASTGSTGGEFYF